MMYCGGGEGSHSRPWLSLIASKSRRGCAGAKGGFGEVMIEKVVI